VSTAALILAAGESKRFGSPKQLIDWRGTPLLRHVIDQVREWPVDAVFVVLGANAEKIMESVDLEGTTVVENLGWSEGIASSLRVGLDALENAKGFERVFVALADQPKVRLDVVEHLLAEQKRSKLPVAVPRYRYTWGNPVLIHRSIWDRIMANIAGDSGARSLFIAHPEWVEEVWFEDMPPRDIDTQFDFEDMSPKGPPVE
jgi:molybdenum cofactor cytidylyltransferase